MNNNCQIWGNKCCFDHLFSFFCSSFPAQKSVRVWACRLHPWEKAAGCTILCFKINQSNMWASQVIRGSKRMWNSSLRYVWSDSFQSIAYNKFKYMGNSAGIYMKLHQEKVSFTNIFLFVSFLQASLRQADPSTICLHVSWWYQVIYENAQYQDVHWCLSVT